MANYLAEVQIHSPTSTYTHTHTYTHTYTHTHTAYPDADEYTHAVSKPLNPKVKLLENSLIFLKRKGPRSCLKQLRGPFCFLYYWL